MEVIEMSWHNFQRNGRYSLAEVIAVCERRIADGGVIRGANKQRLVDLMREHAPQEVVWSPFSTGWGASPFNPGCWHRINGDPVVPGGVIVSKLPDADAYRE